jgi:phospholipase C
MVSRRTFLKGSAAAGVAVAGGVLWTTAIHPRRVHALETPIRHVIVACQENRSFDHYFGYAPQVQAAGFGPPPGFVQPDGPGGGVHPYRLTSLSTPDLPHDWTSVHGQWDRGAMDGFVRHSGIGSLGYYTEQELPFYYGLFEDSTLCVNFFASVLGPTWPNRFYLMSGTSGGITTDSAGGYGVFDHPMILDVLDAAGITWKVYTLSRDRVPRPNPENVSVFWKAFARDERTRASRNDFLDDLRTDRLPNVSFLISSEARGWDEHPPASVALGWTPRRSS